MGRWAVAPHLAEQDLYTREMTPNGSSPGNGAIRYILRSAQDRLYNAAGQLTKVETHNGCAYARIAETSYDGEGNRARLVTWAGSTPLTTTYTYQLVEWTQVLQAKAGVRVWRPKHRESAQIHMTSEDPNCPPETPSTQTPHPVWFYI